MPDVTIENINVTTGELDRRDPPKSPKRRWRLGVEDMGLCFLRACCAELIGTCLLILICVGCANSRVLGALYTGSLSLRPLYYLGISIAFGFGIGGIVHILSDASGGHVNPAVSFALFLERRVSFLQMLFYIISQFAGGFLGAGILYGIGNHGADGLTIYGGNAYTETDINHAQAFFLEAFGTMFLILTILSTIEEGRGHAPSYLQPFSIGISILVMHIWLIPYTNCGINPVRGSVWNIVIGQATVQTLVFVFAPFVGSIIAVLLYNGIFKAC